MYCRLPTCGRLSIGLLALTATSLRGGQPLPEGPGRKTLESACTACHKLDPITARHWSNQQWTISVNSMIARGATLNRDQATELIAYLEKNFGKSRGQVLFEDICSSCHALERVAKQSLNRAEWSEFIKGMISEGNPVNDDEFGLIVDYLAERYGPVAKETK